LAIEQSLDGVHRVSKIVMAMKEFSHPGGQEKKSLDLNRAIQTTLDISRNAWKYMADVVTRFDPDLPPVPCFSDEFNQVILNLVVNAAQAMADKGKENENVKGTITITTRSDKGWVEILIEDDGGGIPEEIQTKIFDPFFTTKPVGVGTGQGLSIVHSIVTKQHQGTITFSSQVNRGTTFCVRLPIHPEK
ncbi:MAG: histidine kinase, partial [Nitrospinae bacterium CG11_big_fil_rev_8_21_14_0_20_56_8]